MAPYVSMFACITQPFQSLYHRILRAANRIVYTVFTCLTQPLESLSSQDMTPYVPMLMPELQKVLVDPLPEVRAVAARALSSLLQGMGAEYFSDLVPWLMEMLKSEGSSVERSGAAQVRSSSHTADRRLLSHKAAKPDQAHVY